MERYRRKYWPESRRLRRYRILVARLDGYWGQIEPEERVLRIDISKHPSDRRVRATVLHEMIHAAVGVGHGVRFWAELERLLKLRAPIRVGFPEMGEQSRHLCVIPKRFRRCRALFRPVYLRQQREIQRLPSYTMTPEAMASECEDAALNGLTWRDVWRQQARLYGFVDMDGKLLPFAERYRVACRRGYRRGRQDFLDTERAAVRYRPKE